ncbi:hypothetical protein GUITHDRAFT_106192 [Guillardia theta CCMP2712]|uniref:Uncharacterized protein n=1 Tax=Guillardia theta (strain CCMP2712) TaxID=905079 RepID=L1JJ43_GUITC|nr:hypothetical protein GUITHDRAFT_106191 [Guillardia theta CCMP2712]XP_005835096.1 hypothetical protein GUITHDRAFT_106192 [Guillardia theta CCMP2712]EKX48115.1 hypothetical protein GUITHDRAFT_106191 [Guillardia theta CCMP2712]EKX48116.1 hypothetical protein GUITHDRAFT_106192 [Guillardia theta CCMP2712]|eukprot:XP_005835095.1 hypothetical protein GUITHDRAFT_106191 [Guillardia theta CCMP2712]
MLPCCLPRAPSSSELAAALLPEPEDDDLLRLSYHRWPLDAWDLIGTPSESEEAPHTPSSPASSGPEASSLSLRWSDKEWGGGGEEFESCCWLEPLEPSAAEPDRGGGAEEAPGLVAALTDLDGLVGPRKRRAWTEEERGAHSKACHGKSKLSLMQKLEIIELYETTTWMSQTEIAAIFGRSRSAISKILRPESVRKLKQATAQRGGVDVRRTRLTSTRREQSEGV